MPGNLPKLDSGEPVPPLHQVSSNEMVTDYEIPSRSDLPYDQKLTAFEAEPVTLTSAVLSPLTSGSTFPSPVWAITN